MTRPASPSDPLPAAGPSAPPAPLVAAMAGMAIGYFALLHWLVVGGSRPLLAAALIVAPWAFAAASLVRSWALRATHTARAAQLLMLAAAVAATTAVAAAVSTPDATRFAGLVAAHVDLLLLTENTTFLLVLAGVFAVSLRGRSEALVTRLARIVRNGDMPGSVVRYTRRVTAAWALFFMVTAVVSSLLFATQSRELWSAFVNLLLWPLVGAMFALEYAVRRRVLRGVDHSPMLRGVQAFHQRGRTAALDPRGKSP